MSYVKIFSNFTNSSVFFNNFNKILFRNLSIIPKRLNGKIAIVTASTDGIGLAIAKRLAQEGSKVIVSSRTQDNVDRAISKLNAEDLDVTGLVCNVANAEDRKKVFDAAANLGGLDILVSNAAVNPSQTGILKCSEKDWDEIFKVNVKASFLLAKEGLPLMKKRNGGKIIFISCALGFHPQGFKGAYTVSKTALFGLTKAASGNLMKENITVNCVAPGLMKTKFSKSLTKNEDLDRLVIDKHEAFVQMKHFRFGEPHEISGVVAFLASDDASYVTGETIVAAGGILSRL